MKSVLHVEFDMEGDSIMFELERRKGSRKIYKESADPVRIYPRLLGPLKFFSGFGISSFALWGFGFDCFHQGFEKEIRTGSTEKKKERKETEKEYNERMAHLQQKKWVEGTLYQEKNFKN